MQETGEDRPREEPGGDRPAVDAVCIEGTVERVVYESPDTGFLVARLQQDGQRGLTTFVGNVMAISPGETIRLWGRWVEDKKWGRQLRVERYETVLPATVNGIERYLGSGLIDGIGPKFAERLVKAFGVETLRVIDEEPERLRKVEGIGQKRAAQIREAWSSQKAIQSIMLFLQGHGIGVGQAVRIYKCYGDGAVAVLRKNPYRLAEDIVGIGFRSADKIAASLGIAKDAPQRLEAGLTFTLDEATGQGHMFLSKEELFEVASALLEVDAASLEDRLVALVRREMVVLQDECVYLRRMYFAETGCDQLIKRILGAPAGIALSIHVDNAIQWVEKQHKIALSEGQREALAKAATSKMLVITGGPGTGKTTVINSLIAVFEKKNVSILLAAPTGRAAKRMENATKRAAKTIHRLLEWSPKETRFLRDENNPLDADLIIIDETSMIDCLLMHSLLKAVPVHARLFLVGDVDQLPSVGPGNVLMDVLSSNVVPVVWLKTVFRQAEESGIISNAHRINTGQYPDFNITDFFFVERKDPVRAIETVIELVTDRIPKKFGFDPVKDIQVLAPMHRGATGVTRLNEALQAALNPDGEPVPRKNFRKNDKVMQMRNNYELDVYNGDAGIVRLVDEETKEIEVVFDDRVVLYGFDNLDDLALAYATTVHKAQGSEYPAIVLPLLPQDYLMLQRNLLYTAVTRGKQIVVIVGDPRAVGRAVHNDKIARRNTRLAERLRNEL
ncbi:MAG: exodeoxyribonuclease alpha subunit [Candidatus Hydrogenedentes bacterium]|nr:exodeoxyribonuclease alpha subunit [Candidatus Hydrogenedentota bacterium]